MKKADVESITVDELLSRYAEPEELESLAAYARHFLPEMESDSCTDAEALDIAHFPITCALEDLFGEDHHLTQLCYEVNINCRALLALWRMYRLLSPLQRWEILETHRMRTNHQ